MTTYRFPPVDKTLYGLTTGTVYEVEEGGLAWMADGQPVGFYSIAVDEPDGVTDVPPPKVGDTVSTIEELEALPTDTILREVSSDEAWQRGSYLWFCRVGTMTEYSASAMSLRGAFIILWLPEGEGEQA